jgi:hypothetical protein
MQDLRETLKWNVLNSVVHTTRTRAVFDAFDALHTRQDDSLETIRLITLNDQFQSSLPAAVRYSRTPWSASFPLGFYSRLIFFVGSSFLYSLFFLLSIYISLLLRITAMPRPIDINDYYRILDIPRGATKEEIREAYKRMVKKTLHARRSSQFDSPDL